MFRVGRVHLPAPNGGFTGSDAFTYSVSDLGGNQVIATVLVTVQPVVVTDALSLNVFSGSVSRPHLVYGVAGPSCRRFRREPVER